MAERMKLIRKKLAHHCIDSMRGFLITVATIDTIVFVGWFCLFGGK